jgi:hypothetical protein
MNEKMQCIFLSEVKACHAQLPSLVYWKVDNETLKTYCENKSFKDCPRFRAYMEYKEKLAAR